MGKLNIAHHKSYHPYRLDNIARVKQDEEEAELKEAREEGRILLADSEARMQLLRERAGLGPKSSKEKKREEDRREKEILERATSSSGPPATVTKEGHINLFEDLEQNSMAAAIQLAKRLDKGKGKEKAEDEKGIALAPSEKDLKPWYSDKEETHNKMDDVKRIRDLSHKSLHDPLTDINHQLAVKYPSVSSRSSQSRPQRSTNSQSTPSELQSRLSRESSERQRAEELKRRKQRERERLAGSETPSTVHGGLRQDEWEYGNQFNRKDVADAHRNRRGWGESDRDPRRERWGA